MMLQIRRPISGGIGYLVYKDGWPLEYYFTFWGAKRGFKKWKKKLLNKEKNIKKIIISEEEFIIYEEELTQ